MKYRILLFAILVGLCLTVQPTLFSQAKAPTGVVVKQFDRDAMQRLITHRDGKLLVVNFWATWCAPCVEEFPDLSKLADAYAGKRVEFAAVSLDVQEELPTKVTPFLHDKSKRISYFINAFEKDEQLIDGISSTWSGAIPATVVFDAQGKQQNFFLGKQSYATLSKEIDKLLSGSR